MTIIPKTDFITSITQALQQISYCHSQDFLNALHNAYKSETSTQAKNALAHILINSRQARINKRPLCQDTGIVSIFLKIGMNVKFDSDLTIQEMVDEGVEAAYLHEHNPLRLSIVKNPASTRCNTQANTPAIIHTEFISGNKVIFKISAKGGGTENKSTLLNLTPAQNITVAIVKTVLDMGYSWCPPGIIGIGIGGNSEKAITLAKEALFEPIDIENLKRTGATNNLDKLRLEIFNKINKQGLGAQGLGGNNTVLDVKIKNHPTHAACLPVAIVVNCVATRHIEFTLDGTGPAKFIDPPLTNWPNIKWQPTAAATKIHSSSITRKEIATWQPNQEFLLSGKLIIMRDAAHNRLLKMYKNNEPLPINLNERFIYYAGPAPKTTNEIIGPIGPTTSKRMDKHAKFMLEEMKIKGTIGKGERDPQTLLLFKKHKAASFSTTGGAAYFLTQFIKSFKLITFEDLGMEAIYEVEVEDLPVINQ